ncbi:MAG: LamG domain-containing protein [Treponema sp.]|nr:LamG domain-containing protein [Treponema sp.]
MKNNSFISCATAALCLIPLLFIGCPDDREYLSDASEVAPPVVSFAVNAAGDAFESTTPGYTATVHDGGFETVNGLKVFNTGGTVNNANAKKFTDDLNTVQAASPQGDECPWAKGSIYWDHYENIGYVDLGAASGDLIASLGAFSIELYFCLPANAQSDRVGQYFFGFTDKVAPDNSLWLSWGNPSNTVIKKAGQEVRVALNWEQSEANRGERGQWHHLVFTANGTTVKVYLDGAEAMSGAAAWSANYFSAGTLNRNVLGGEVFANGIYDQQLFNTKFHSFSIYDYALNADQVMYNRLTGPLDALN